MKKRILLVKLGALGDAALLIPAAKAIHDTGVEIEWLCGRSIVPLLQCYSWITPIPVDDSKLFGRNRFQGVLEMWRIWARMAFSRYELCGVLHYDWRYRLLGMTVRARVRKNLKRNQRDQRLVAERHHSSEYLRILVGFKDERQGQTLRPVRPDRLPQCPLPPGSSPRIALVPGGARNVLRDDHQRRWPMENFVELANQLNARGITPLLIGGPSDRWASAAFGNSRVTDLIARFSIPETIALLDSCDIVVTADSGLLHMAGLVGCKVIALFGPTAPSKCVPQREGVIAIWGGRGLACWPCYDGRDYSECDSPACMAMISVAEVMNRIDTITFDARCCGRIDTL